MIYPQNIVWTGRDQNLINKKTKALIAQRETQRCGESSPKENSPSESSPNENSPNENSPYDIVAQMRN